MRRNVREGRCQHKRAELLVPLGIDGHHTRRSFIEPAVGSADQNADPVGVFCADGQPRIFDRLVAGMNGELRRARHPAGGFSRETDRGIELLDQSGDLDRKVGRVEPGDVVDTGPPVDHPFPLSATFSPNGVTAPMPVITTLSSSERFCPIALPYSFLYDTHDVRVDCLLGYSNGVLDRFAVGPAVSDDDDAGYPEQRSASVV